MRSRKQKTNILQPNDPCLCGSGKALKDCHLDPVDGRLRKHLPPLSPPGPPTGFAHPRCYLRDTCDCSTKISREHYMSKAILEQLEQLDAVLRVSGMPWLKAGQTLDTSVASLTAKILCQRHNEALSPLDTEAARFFYILREAVDDLKRKTLSLKPILHLVDGAALELWMVKVACGLYYSGATKDGVKVSNTHRINLEKARRALFQRDWDARAGLYFVESGNKVAVQDSVAMAPITADNDSIFVGANVSLLGFTMGALFDDSKTIPLPWPGFKRRPSEFILIKNRRQHTIFLASWPPGTEWASVGYRWHHGLQWG